MKKILSIILAISFAIPSSAAAAIAPVFNGGTGWGNVQANALLYGNGTGRLATTTQGSPGQVLGWVNGIPTWVATSSVAAAETDPLSISKSSYFATTTHKNISSLPALTITESQISNLQAYLTSESDPLAVLKSLYYATTTHKNISSLPALSITKSQVSDFGGPYLTSETDPLSISIANFFSTTTHAKISSLPALSITKSQVSDFGSYESPLTVNFPLTRSANAISNAMSTTSNTGMTPNRVMYLTAAGIMGATATSSPGFYANGGTNGQVLGVTNGVVGWVSTSSQAYVETDPLAVLSSQYYGTTTHKNISSLPALSITKSQVSDFGGPYLTTVDISANTNLAVTYPVILTGDTLSVAATSTAYAGTAGQILAFLNGAWTGTATTTAGTGLTFSAGAFSVNSSQSIATLSNLTTNGFVQTSGAAGTLGVQTFPCSAAQGCTGGTSLSPGFSVISNVFSSVDNYTYVYPATSTAQIMFGSSTVIIALPTLTTKYNSVRCLTDVGTLNFQVGIGTASTTMYNASSTPNINTYGSNNSFTSANTVFLTFGTPAASVHRFTCSWQRTI